MHLFDAEGKIERFSDPRDIIQGFFDTRIGAYAERKRSLLEQLQAEFDKLENKVLTAHQRPSDCASRSLTSNHRSTSCRLAL